MRDLDYLNHSLILSFLLCSLVDGECHILERTPRRCNNGGSVISSTRHQTYPPAPSDRPDPEETDFRPMDRYGPRFHQSAIERLTHRRGNMTRLDLWPSHGLNRVNSSWGSMNSRPNIPNQHELVTEPTTTESSNDIERFLVGRRKRSALWMNPNLYHNRAIGSSLSGSGNYEQDEEDMDSEMSDDIGQRNNGGGGRTASNTRQLIRERTFDVTNRNGFPHTHNGGHGLHYGNTQQQQQQQQQQNSNNNRMPYFMQRTNPLLKLKLV